MPIEVNVSFLFLSISWVNIVRAGFTGGRGGGKCPSGNSAKTIPLPRFTLGSISLFV